MTKDAFYFSHDSNAHKDPKVLKLRAKFGWEGYGIYWAIIETLRDQTDYKWKADDKQLLSFCFANGDEVVKQVIDECLSVGLLIEEDEYIHSESLTRRMKMKDAISEKRREAGRKGGASKKKANAKQTPSNKGNKGNKVNENKYSDEFDQFWSVYPKKADKGVSFKKFQTKRKEHSLESILEGAKKYAYQMKKNGTETQFIKNASTFLNNNSFLDDYEEQNKTQSYYLPNDKNPDLIRLRKDAEEQLQKGVW